MAFDRLGAAPLRPGRLPGPGASRTLEVGPLLIGAGAILLFLSLFLAWYHRGVDAWTAFEAWDLILAAIAVIALVAAAGRLGFGAPRPASWLIGPSVAALVIVVFVVINPPPMVSQAHANGTGLWLGLVASVLMALGALLSVARFTVALASTEPSVGTMGTGPAEGITERERADRAATPPTTPTRPI